QDGSGDTFGIDVEGIATTEIGHIDAAGGRVLFTHPVGRREVDAAAVIRTGVIVEVALVLTTDLDEVVPLQDGDVIAEEVVLPIPEAGADVLGVDVEGRQDIGGAFTEGLHRTAEAGDLRRSVIGSPLPEVAQI